MIRPDFVIFDCDGVLVDSEPVTARLLQRSLADHGLEMTEERIDLLFTGGTMAGVAEKAREMGAKLPPSWRDDFYEVMYAELARDTPLIEGVMTVLDRLDAAGVPYAVGSNGADRKMGITLGQHPDLMARLEGRLYSAHSLGVAKPDPELYLIPAREAGVEPGRCAVIDDSPTGCTAGVRAGMRTLGFAAHDDGARLAAVGAEVFHRMADLPGLLGV
jgi:HAD superfamily hydrolase (TIGR01509 family)